MEQLSAPDPGRRTIRSLSPRMIAFIAADAVLVAGFLVFLVVFLAGSFGGQADDAGTEGTAVGTPSSSGTAPGPSSPGSSGAAGAQAEIFALPSGNIACEITADAATCTIANTSAAPPPDANCTGSIGHELTVTAKGAEMPCVQGALPGVAAKDTKVLDYGQSTTVGAFTCTSSSTGVTCKHDPTGMGFQLAKAAATLF